MLSFLIFWQRISAQKQLLKCRWNWLPVSISSKFYKQFFCANVLCAAFLYFLSDFVIFWWKNIGAKAACKMLVKLTTGTDESEFGLVDAERHDVGPGWGLSPVRQPQRHNQELWTGSVSIFKPYSFHVIIENSCEKATAGSLWANIKWEQQPNDNINRRFCA